MDLIDKLQQLSAQIPKQLSHITTEEGTKTALVMPFITALGYDVFDLSEVVPEFTADIGTKKGEKVDYAILMDGKPIMLFECKSVDTQLRKEHFSQLYRYFPTTKVRFAILTNGVEYWFFADLDRENVMDDTPFLVFNMKEFDERLVDELKKFTKSAFDIEGILSAASDLKYKRQIKNAIAREFNDPSEEFVRYFTKQVYSRPLFQSALEEFTRITKAALRTFVREQIESSLKSALDTEAESTQEIEVVEVDADADERQIVTTQEELDGYFIVKSILREIVDSKRIAIRDTASYCGVLLDDNNRKPVCRLHFNRTQKYLGLFDEKKNEERIPIDTVDDIYQYAERLKETVSFYD